MPQQPQDLDEELDGLEETSEQTGQTTSTTQKAPNRRTSGNWKDDPEYQRMQSQRDKAVAAAQRAAYEAEQRAAQLEAQFHQMRMSSMSEQEQLAYQNQLLQAQLQQERRQRELDAFAIQRDRDLKEIARKTGIPLEQIENAPDVHAAWSIAIDWKENQRYGKKKKATRQRDEYFEDIDDTDEDEVDDTVDVGGGKASSRSTTLQQEYDKHRKSFNLKGQLEAMAKADRYGITLNEW